MAFGAAAFLAVASAAPGQSGEVERISVLGVKNSFLVSAANDAYSLALEKLSHPNCQKIFSDFRDAKGRPIQAHLDSLGHTATSFLRILRFANGERLEPCQSRGVLAATTPFSHVVFLCGLQFFQREHEEPDFAAALVIHEMLHSLGLGENPPSSNEITAGVVARCGARVLGQTPPETATARLLLPVSSGPGLSSARR